MSDYDINEDKYSKFQRVCSDCNNLYISLYQLKTENEKELHSIYEKIKTILIDSKKYSPQNIICDILNIIPYKNRYIKSYLELAKFISDDYQVNEVKNIPNISNFMFYNDYGIKLCKSQDFKKMDKKNLEILKENTIYKAIMNNDLERFISFTESGRFYEVKKIRSHLYPYSEKGYSFLELCCYYGAVDCFKFLRTKFNSEITRKCLEFSFLGGNPEIMSECLKYQKPNKDCMKYAIISHNIDFVTFLMNEYNLKIVLESCVKYKNLESFFVVFDQTNDADICFYYSINFNVLLLYEYFLPYCSNINKKYKYEQTALHIATYKNEYMVELLLSHGATVSEKDQSGKTALHYAAEYNCERTAELLLSHGVNINEKDRFGKTALHIATEKNYIEIAKLLISHGATVNGKDVYHMTALHYVIRNKNEYIVELLLSHGATVSEKDQSGKTALHYAAEYNCERTAELLLSHGANINEKDNFGQTALHIAAEYNRERTAELLLSHGANIKEKDKYKQTALQLATDYNCKATARLLIRYANACETQW